MKPEQQLNCLESIASYFGSGFFKNRGLVASLEPEFTPLQTTYPLPLLTSNL